MVFGRGILRPKDLHITKDMRMATPLATMTDIWMDTLKGTQTDILLDIPTEALVTHTMTIRFGTMCGFLTTVLSTTNI